MTSDECPANRPSCMLFQRKMGRITARKIRRIFVLFRAIICVLALLATPIAHSAWAPKEQLNAVTRETQKTGNRAGRLTLVWWMPPEFWKLAMLATGTLPADKVDEAVARMEDANVFLVIDGKINPLGIDYTTPADLQKNFSVGDPNGQPLLLIPDNQQSAAIRNLLAVMSPVLANMLGDFGKHASFFVFEGKAKNGLRRVDPKKPGVLIARFAGEDFRWRLPLGSLLPPKICPKCKESFPGNYSFCPFDATPLTEQKNQ